MRRDLVIRLAACCAFALTCFPLSALAGGSEYAGDGTRGLGRGGAVMTRPDDPRVMVRNPALLADLWGSMIYMNVNLGFPDSCIQPSGGYGWGEETPAVLLLDPDEGPIYTVAREGSIGGPDPDNPVPLQGYQYEPYPQVCYKGGPQIGPSVGLTTKWHEKLGVGIGFMPPELASGNQYGNMDGTIETPNGMRPNPVRYMDSGRAATYFGLLGAVGYRIVPWLRVGAGLRWSMAHADVITWNKYGLNDLDPATDIRIHYYGRDMFIPGFTASVHAVPVDALDIAVGFHWEEQVKFPDAKLDMLTSPFGYGKAFYYSSDPAGDPALVSPEPLVPYWNYNVPGRITAPPVTPPQLSFGIRFADRINPRPEKYSGLQTSTDPVRDPMADERWDIEFNFIYFMNNASDNMNFYLSKDQRITRISERVDGSGTRTMSGPPGECTGEEDETGCLADYVMPITLGGVDQISLRLGGDYNVIPNVFAVRAGVSYEGRGIDPEFIRPTRDIPFERLGLHTGFTWRLDGRTDLTFAFAHFFQETIKIAVNPSLDGYEPGGMRGYLEEAEIYGPAAEMTEGMTQEERQEFVREMYHIVDPSEADGEARQRTGDSPYHVNAGTHDFELNVVGASLARHF